MAAVPEPMPPVPRLGAVHERRLRALWRSAGWPCHDVVEAELLLAGALQRSHDDAGRETLRLTDAGLAVIAAPTATAPMPGAVMPPPDSEPVTVASTNGISALCTDPATDRSTKAPQRSAVLSEPETMLVMS